MDKENKPSGLRLIVLLIIFLLWTGFLTVVYLAQNKERKIQFRRFSSDEIVVADTVLHDWAKDSTLSQKKMNPFNELLSR